MELRELSIHGNKVTYRTAGEGPVMLLIHGMAGSATTWKHVMPALSRRFTVVAPDLLGHGQSEKMAGDFSLGALASSLRDLLVALGHDRATIVGQSLGGGVALQLAYQFPERCERLVLVSSGGLGREVNPILSLLSLPGSSLVLSLASSGPVVSAIEGLAGLAARIGLAPAPVVGEIWRSFSSLGDEDTRRAFLRTLRAVVDVGGQAVSASNRLHLVGELPTLIIWGGDDPIIPVEHAYEAHTAIEGSRLEIFEGAGHYPHVEAPERFVDLLTEFIETTVPGQITVSPHQVLGSSST
jgi:pimeloyl-ACP methyl ester carboxylesterase